MVKQFIPEAYPLGRVKLGQQGQGSFMRPQGDDNLRIKSVTAGCGSCTRVSYNGPTSLGIDFVYTAPTSIPEHARSMGHTEIKDWKHITITYEETDENGDNLLESLQFSVTIFE